jgi:hypothetical protein
MKQEEDAREVKRAERVKKSILDVKMTQKNELRRETSLEASSSIPVQPVIWLKRDGQRFVKQKPRGGSRGVNDTQLFRLETRTTRCLAREATPLLPVCQLFPPGNTLPVDSNVERKKTHMKKQSLLANLVLASALAVAVPVFAKPMSTTLPITHNVKVGQTEIKSGDYRFVIDGNHLAIMNGKKLVAESDGRWEDRDTKSQYNAVVSNADGKVIELRFEGKKSVFVLPN